MLSAKPPAISVEKTPSIRSNFPVDEPSKELDVEGSILDVEGSIFNDVIKSPQKTLESQSLENQDKSLSELEDLLQEYESATRILKSITPEPEENVDDLLQLDDVISNVDQPKKKMTEEETEAMKVEIKNTIKTILSDEDLDK